MSLPLWTPEVSSIHSPGQLPLPAHTHTWKKKPTCRRQNEKGRETRPPARKLAPAASVSGSSQGLEEATTGVPLEPGKTTQQPYLVPKVLQAHLQTSLTKSDSVSASPQIQSVPKKGLSL